MASQGKHEAEKLNENEKRFWSPNLEFEVAGAVVQPSLNSIRDRLYFIL